MVTAYSINNITKSVKERQLTVCVPKPDTKLSLFAFNKKGKGHTSLSLASPAKGKRTCVIFVKLLNYVKFSM